MEIQFLGATHTVTGSKYLIKADNKTLLVDCGLFQGYKELRLRNWSPLPFNPADVDYVILTHAHIDHSGYIPLLVKTGFTGKVLCTEATLDLCEILLPDSGHLHEEETRYANRKGYSKHHPALPLYTEREAEYSIGLFEAVPFEKRLKLGEQLYLTFYYAGHILGASLVRIEHRGVSLLFSGDLGRQKDPIMRPPTPPLNSNYYVIESTYGNRLHEKENPETQLGSIINRTVKRGGVVLIPSFAVGRAQSALYFIHQLKKKAVIPDIPVFVDSPMARDVTELFFHHNKEHRLNRQEATDVCRTAKYIHSIEESKALDTKKMPMIIISASGMITGGRILHHVKSFAPDHRNTIVFCGFQAGNTRGDRMLRGERQVKMLGEIVTINAEIAGLDNVSAHADYQEMLQWLGHLTVPPRKIFITHGENEASEALKEKIDRQFGWACSIPEYAYVETLK